MGALVRRMSTSTNINVGKKRSTVSHGIVEGGDEFNDPMDIKDDFKFEHEGLTTAQAEGLLKIHGHNELPEKVIPKWYIFVSLLWQPMPVRILMTDACFLFSLKFIPVCFFS